jgi:hypothetical protein
MVRDQHEFERSTCLISIGIFGSVPPRCNCTAASPYFTVAGVEMHGSGTNVSHAAAAATTPDQDKMIAALTGKDRALYTVVLGLFQGKVQKFEDRYEFRMCQRNGGL